MNQEMEDLSVPQRLDLQNSDQEKENTSEQIKKVLSLYGEHFEQRKKEDNRQKDDQIPKLNSVAIQNLKSILFLCESLMNVRANIEWTNLSQKLWKAIDVSINKDGDASFVLWNTGLEYLKLIPKDKKFQQKNLTIGTFQVFYYFLAAYKDQSKIKDQKLKNHFQNMYKIGLLCEYKIFGPNKLQQNNQDEDLAKFNQFCDILTQFNIDLIAFFDLIAVCIVQGGEKQEKDNEKLFGQSDNIDQSSLSLSYQGSTGTSSLDPNEKNKQLLNQIKNEEIEYNAIDIYQQALDKIIEVISKLNKTQNCLICIQIIEKGEYITNCEGYDLNFSDFSMNYCKDVFDLYFEKQQDGNIKKKVKIITKFFDTCYQNSIQQHEDKISAYSIKQQLKEFKDISQLDTDHRMSLYHEKQQDNKVEYLKYDLSDLTTLQPVYRTLVLNMFRNQQNQILQSCSINVLQKSILIFIKQRLGRILGCLFDNYFDNQDSKHSPVDLCDQTIKEQQEINNIQTQYSQIISPQINGEEDSISYASDPTRQLSVDPENSLEQREIEVQSIGNQQNEPDNQGTNDQNQQYTQGSGSVVLGISSSTPQTPDESGNNSTESD